MNVTERQQHGSNSLSGNRAQRSNKFGAKNDRQFIEDVTEVQAPTRQGNVVKSMRVSQDNESVAARQGGKLELIRPVDSPFELHSLNE